MLLTILFFAVACVFVLPRLFGQNVYAVASESMEPIYPQGALVFSRGTRPEFVQIGDCITYSQGETTVTHRVTGIDRTEGYFQTKGDANSLEDAPVPFSRLVGKTEAFCIPYLGYLVIGLKKAGTMVIVSMLAITAIMLFVANGSMIYKTRKRGVDHEAKNQSAV